MIKSLGFEKALKTFVSWESGKDVAHLVVGIFHLKEMIAISAVVILQTLASLMQVTEIHQKVKSEFLCLVLQLFVKLA